MKWTRMFMAFTIVLTLSSVAFAVDKAQFDDLMKQIHDKNFTPVEKFLELNKTKLSQDPEYYVVLLNYVLTKGDKSVLVVSPGKPKPDDLEVHDKDSGKVVGFIGNRGGYDEKLIVDGITKTQKALKSFNSRLDIHFGIVAIAEKIKRWDIVGNQLVQILKVSKEINNNWLWGPINSMDGNPRNFMIQNIVSRTAELFETSTPVSDEAFRKVSEALTQFYPKEIYGYANLGLYYATKNRYDLAEQYFKKALKIDPNDKIVLGNMKRLKKLQRNLEKTNK